MNQRSQITMIGNNCLVINGKRIEYPNKKVSHRIVQYNGNIYVDCYALKDGEWHFSLLAIIRNYL